MIGLAGRSVEYDFSMTKLNVTAAWDLAGLTTVDGYLGRRWGTSRMSVPGLIVLGDADTLIWSYGLPGKTKSVRPDRGMLDQFVRLAGDAVSAEEICDYARRWGVLGLCEHGCPNGHSPFCIPSHFMVDKLQWHAEPLETWRYFARSAQAIMNTAARLNVGKATLEDFRAFITQCGLGTMPHSVDDGRWGIRFLSMILDAWLHYGGVGPHLRWENSQTKGQVKGHWNVSLEPARLSPGMFGALGYQLLIAVANSPGLAMCSGCHYAYTPKRALDPRRNHYCQNCGRPFAVREAARRYRERKANFRGTDAVDAKQEVSDVKAR